MTLDSIIERLLNPTVIATVIAAGIAYGMFLWSLNIRQSATLWATATFPGTIFILVIWTIRGYQGTLSAVYLAELALWWIFSNSGFLTVMARRKWLGRAQHSTGGMPDSHER